MTWQPYDHRGRPNTPKSNSKDVAQLDEPLRSRAQQMIVDCPFRGELGIVSGLRDPGSQWDLRLGRVGLARIWNWAFKGNPTTAIPARWNGREWAGGSKHQLGEAIDFGGTERAMRWMHANRERYGLARTVTSERWHQEANRRDTITGRVHDKPTVHITPYGSTESPRWNPPKFHGVLKPNVKGEWVREWAYTLAALGYKGFNIQGDSGAVYGSGKVRATKRFQKNHGLKQDGIVGSITHAEAVRVLRNKRRKAGLPV